MVFWFRSWRGQYGRLEEAGVIIKTSYLKTVVLHWHNLVLTAAVCFHIGIMYGFLEVRIFSWSPLSLNSPLEMSSCISFPFYQFNPYPFQGEALTPLTRSPYSLISVFLHMSHRNQWCSSSGVSEWGSVGETWSSPHFSKYTISWP